MGRPQGRQNGIRFAIKRALDVSIASAGIAISTPIMIGIAAALKATLDEGPIIFRQKRAGKKGRIFEIYKFRTMSNKVDAEGVPLPDEERLTQLGQVLRSLSLDELPQLLNVLRGEMSIVGPRPLHVEYLAHYNSEQARRHDVLPGITGWAQIQGRNNVDWETRFAYDVWYVDHWSMGLDLTILLRTFTAVASRKGISEEGSATMTRFDQS